MPSSPPIPPPPMALDEPLYTGNSESAATAVTTATAQKKGLLWQQRDKLFSRWKERYFVLTKDYFHCFKKNTSRVTEMGGFIFKLKLAEIDSVDLLDKRGYLTICITLLKDGKIYLRRPEGIKDWFMALQSNIYECRRKRKFWASQRQVTDSTGIEQWLLSRQKVGVAASGGGASATNVSTAGSTNKIQGLQYPCGGGSSPNILESSPSPRPEQQQPRYVISRSQIVDKNNNKEKEKTRSRTNLASSSTTVNVIQHQAQVNPSPQANDVSQQQPQQQQHQFGPRGINRLSLVNELILKEKLTVDEKPLATSSSTATPPSSSSEGSPSSSPSADKSSSGRSSLLSSNASSSSSSNVIVVNKTNNGANRNKKGHGTTEDSGNDSGHNSMNTASDSSDSHNSSGEDTSSGNKSKGSNSNNNNGNMVGKSNILGFQTDRSVDCDIVLSSDITMPTTAELKAGKSNFGRFREKATSSSLRKPLYKKTFAFGQVITEV